MKGRYPDMLGLLLYLKKMFDDRAEDELLQGRPDSAEKSRRESPNRYTMRHATSVRAESPMRHTLADKPLVPRKPKTELEKRQEELDRQRAGLLAKIDAVAALADRFE